MKRQNFLAYVPVAVLLGLGLFYILAPTARVAFATTATSTVIGWLVPDGTHFNAGIPVLMFTILGMTSFAMLGKIMGLERNVPTLALVGLVAGSLLGMLSLGNSTAGNVVPFAMPVVAGIDLILFVWMGGD